MKAHYQHIVVSGTASERGYSHGLQARDKIITNITRYKASPSLGSQQDCLKYINDSYIPAAQKFFPDGLDEMEGIARGAGAEVEDIALLNARYDLARLTGHKVGECTSMSYIGPGGAAIVAQNWDMAAWLHDLDTIIVLESHLPVSDVESRSASPDTTIPTSPKVIIALTEAGQLARSGMNSLGLGLCANSLWCNEDKPPAKPCLPFTLARTMYLHCPNFAAGLKTLATFPRHVSGNLMVASLDLSMDLELTPSRTFTIHPEVQVFEQANADDDNVHLLLTHANHYQREAINSTATSITYDTYPGGSSLFRDRRLSQLLQARLRQQTKLLASARSQLSDQVAPSRLTTKKIPPPITPPEEHQNDKSPPISGDALIVNPWAGVDRTENKVVSLDVPSLKWAFADHASFPRSLCEHHDKGVQKYGAASGGATMTVASVIYDLRQGEMHVSTGNPCQGEACWSTYSIEMEV
ncbi:hypothetical protein G7046_g7760 [Stylonectria norvegica]|nr:hypothetical protein G7046_g7760 [Stylonectria norvegica]